MQQVSYNSLFIFTSDSCASIQIRICFNRDFCSKVVEFAHANKSPLVSYAAFWQSQRISDGIPSSGCGYKSGLSWCGVTCQSEHSLSASTQSAGTFSSRLSQLLICDVVTLESGRNAVKAFTKRVLFSPNITKIFIKDSIMLNSIKQLFLKCKHFYNICRLFLSNKCFKVSKWH